VEFDAGTYTSLTVARHYLRMHNFMQGPDSHDVSAVSLTFPAPKTTDVTKLLQLSCHFYCVDAMYDHQQWSIPICNINLINKFHHYGNEKFVTTITQACH
jgi:hypothetical protein